MAGDPTRERLVAELTEQLTSPLRTIGLDLEALEVTPAGRRRILRVAVDKDGGVTLDDIAEATKELSRVLDGAAAMGEQPYTLEVTSPGVDRPLTHPRHWRRNRGRLVSVATRDGASVTGRVAESDETGAVLDVKGARSHIDFASVARATVQIEFKRPSEAGRSAAPAPARVEE